MSFLLNSLNGFIYLKRDIFKKALILFDIKYKQHTFSFNNAWLSGFFEGDGTVNINRVNYQVMLSISQKKKDILNLILKYYGGFLFYDKAWNGFRWSITSQKDLFLIFQYFTLYPLKSDKHADIVSAKRFFRYKLMSYHLDSSKHSKLNHYKI